MRTQVQTLFLLLSTSVAALPQAMPENPTALVRVGENQREALKINDSIYQAIGFGNTFLVTTPDGNVIIDTSMPQIARRHLPLLKAVTARRSVTSSSPMATAITPGACRFGKKRGHTLSHSGITSSSSIIK